MCSLRISCTSGQISTVLNTCPFSNVTGSVFVFFCTIKSKYILSTYSFITTVFHSSPQARPNRANLIAM